MAHCNLEPKAIMIKQDIDLNPQQAAYWLVFSQDEVMFKTGSDHLLFCPWQQLDMLHAYRQQVVKVGHYQDKPCYMVDMGNEAIDTEGWQTQSLRALLMCSDAAFFDIAARAWQVAVFMRTHRFCGQCGSRMQQVKWEMATQCHQCKHRCYPRISPCIIVAIRDNDRILLAQGRAHQTSNIYSTLAGFVESGETLEQAVHREVFEEVGVNITNLQYFASQPWPFPHSLMMGFLAEYQSGEIQVDGNEIIDANWYRKDALPNIPPPFTIAGRLIAATLGPYMDSQ